MMSGRILPSHWWHELNTLLAYEFYQYSYSNTLPITYIPGGNVECNQSYLWGSVSKARRTIWAYVSRGTVFYLTISQLHMLRNCKIQDIMGSSYFILLPS